MKYFLFFTCLICVLLHGTEVTSLSIFSRKTSLSLLGSPKTTTTTTTTTKKPLQKATNGLVSSLTNLLGLGATTTTPIPTTAQPISKLNELSQSESSYAEKLDSSKHVILSDFPKVISSSPSTSDISTDVLPVQNTDDCSKKILLESPQAGSVNNAVPNVEVDQISKLNDLLNDEKQNAEAPQTAGEEVIDQGLKELNIEQTMEKSIPNSDTENIPIISNVSQSGSKIIGSFLNLDLASPSVPEVESKNPVEEDPLQFNKNNEDKLELSSSHSSLQKQDVPLIPEVVPPLSDSSNIVDTDSLAPAPIVEMKDINTVIPTESSNQFQTTSKHMDINPLVVSGTDVESTPENVSASNSDNNNLPFQEDPSAVQSNTEAVPSYASESDTTQQDVKPTVCFKPVIDMDSLEQTSKVVLDIPAVLPVKNNSDVKTTISPETPEALTVPSPVAVLNNAVSTDLKGNSPQWSVNVRLPETSTVGVSSSLLSALATALPSIPGLGDLLIYLLSVLSALLATISDRIGISLENLIAKIPTLYSLLESLMNMPGIPTEIQRSFVVSTGESFKFLSRFEVNGIGGLIDLLNFALSFLYGLLQSVSDLLRGIPLATVLKVLPNFIGTFENILPNLSVGTLGTLHQVAPAADSFVSADRVTENSIEEYMDTPLIDIHHNEINLLKIVIV